MTFIGDLNQFLAIANLTLLNIYGRNKRKNAFTLDLPRPLRI